MDETLTTAAFEAVRDFEAIATGTPYGERLRAAESAVAELRAAASEGVFPTMLRPCSEATLRDLDEFASELADPQRAALLHERSLAGQHEELAAAIRGPRGERILRAALAVSAARLCRNEAEHVSAGRRLFETLIAAQLRDRDEFAPSAALLAEALPLLEQRVAIARERHEAHSREEADRLAAENRAADQVLAAEKRNRRLDLAERIQRLPQSVTFDFTLQDGTVREMQPRQVASWLVEDGVSEAFVQSMERQFAPFVPLNASA